MTLAVATPTRHISPRERYARAGRAAGCPADQLANFRRGEYVAQPKQLQFHAAAREGDRRNGPTQIGQGGARGGAKALALDTPIPTVDGWKTMGTILPGDRVFAPDGTVTTVLACSDVMRDQPCYQIAFSDGAVIVADAGHQWITFNKRERVSLVRRTDAYRERRRRIRPRRGTGKRPDIISRNQAREYDYLPTPQGKIRTTREIAETLHYRDETNHAILTSAPLELPITMLPIDPYVLGVWLGDGDSGRGYVTSADPEIIAGMQKAGYHSAYRGRYRYAFRGLTTKLRQTGVLNNKRIPPVYLRASREQRLALLQGLMDTDGTINKRGQCTIGLTNHRLLLDIWELLQSLGIKAQVRENIAKLNGRIVSPVWRIKFYPSISVFRLTRKATRQKPAKSRRAQFRYIVDVSPVSSVPVRCITVEHESHCYLVSRNFIPTHNSHAMACQIVFDDCYRAPGIKWLYLRSVGASARESFEDLLTKAMPGMMQHYVRARSALELPNGSRVLLGGFRNERDIDKYVGIEYDGIAIDDAHLISKAKYDLIRGSQRTSREDWRPRTYVTFNPGGIGHAHLKALFVQPWRAKRETNTRFFFSLPEHNAFLNPEYVQYLEGLTGWLYKAWRKGDFDIAAGQFFTTWRQDAHVVPSFRPPHDWRFWLAMDYGFTHWNVVLLLAEDNDGNVYVVDEHAERKWLVPRHVAAVDAMLERWSLSRQRIWRFVAGADVFAKTGTTGGTIAEQWARAGLKLSAANDDRINGAAEVLHRLGDVESDPPIMPTLRIFDNCARLIECLPSLEHDPHRPEDVLKTDTDENGNGGDDTYDTLRYGLLEVARRRYGRIYTRDY